MIRNKLLLLVLPFILVGMSFTGCGESTKEKTGSSKAKVESPKEKAMGLLDDLEQAIRDRDDVRAEEISAELEKIDIESFSEEDQKEIMEKSVEIMGAAFEEAGEMMSEYGEEFDDVMDEAMEEFDAAMEEAMKEFDY